MSFQPFIKLFDYFFVLRPVLFVPGWSTLLAGYLIASKNRIFLSPDEILSQDWIALVSIISLFAFAMGATFLLNQMKDIESDLKNNKLFLLSEKHISKKAARIETVVLITFSLLIAYSTNYYVLIDTILFLIITGYAYNFKPLNLKDRPWGSVFANSAMGILAFSLGWHAQQGYIGSLWIDAAPYLFFNTALYFFTILPDVPGDRKSNKKTLAVQKGEQFVINISFLCYLAALICAIVFKDYFALLIIISSSPFFILAFVHKEVAAAIRSTKFSIFFFALVVCFKLPLYLFLLLIIFIGTKWYFKERFQINYPNFKGE